jgi:hypothetical protein
MSTDVGDGLDSILLINPNDESKQLKEVHNWPFTLLAQPEQPWPLNRTK